LSISFAAVHVNGVGFDEVVQGLRQDPRLVPRCSWV
jgi:hypothetical protein